MSELIAIVYPSEQCARAAMATLQRLRLTHIIEVEDACYVTRDDSGDLELHQSVSTVRRGAVAGAFWGALVGAFFVNPGLGAAAGAGLGALAGHRTDFGIPDELIRELSTAVRSGGAALFVLLHEAPPTAFDGELASHGGRLLYSSLPNGAHQRLHSALEQAVIAEVGAATDEGRNISRPT